MRPYYIWQYPEWPKFRWESDKILNMSWRQPWLEWFLRTLKEAMQRSVDTVSRVVKKSMFWQEHRDVAMNERQVKVVNRLWDGFEGKLTSVKWAKICKTSQATALRDINDLILKGILVKGEDGSKNTNYILSEDK